MSFSSFSNLVKFRSFRSQVITSLAIVLLLVLGTVFLSVNRTTYNNTRAVIDENLEIGLEVFTQLIKERETNFRVTFRALARDFAFRETYYTRDYDTILSAGENLLLRTTNADLLMVVDYDYLMVADTLRRLSPESQFPWSYLLEAAEEDDDYEASSFILIDNIAYQVVAVPILTPLVDGWIIVGQRLDTDYVSSLKEIISSDVSIIQLNEKGQATPLATTLPDNQADELAVEYNAYSAGDASTGMLDLDGEDFVALATPLIDNNQLSLSALVQQSLPQALTPYRELEQRLIILFALGLGLSLFLAIILGRSVSKPVMSLVTRVGKIERGDYGSSGNSKRLDEIGRLENSVNEMAVGLAEKEKVRDILGKVVSREIAEELMSGKVNLGGETRTATILFSDIRDFTSLCESQAPEAILGFLNHYLSEVSSAIEEHKGVVDKYIGDAVMALFGAPVSSEHDVNNALLAALAMRSRVEQMNNASRSSGTPELKTGIGIHSGEVVAGNLGSLNRMNYTVIGDTVNLASRLESLTKQYDVSTIVSEETRNLGVGFIYRELDLVRVKGKNKPVRIYELLGLAGQLSDSEINEINYFEQGLAAYRSCNWQQADEIFNDLASRNPAMRLYSLYLERVKTCRLNPPDKDWDGVFTFQGK